MDAELLFLIVRLVAGSAAAFSGILLWSRTRDIAWLFVIVGAILLYAVILFDALVYFGVLSFLPLNTTGRMISESIFRSLPYIFFTIGFIAAIRRRS